MRNKQTINISTIHMRKSNAIDFTELSDGTALTKITMTTETYGYQHDELTLPKVTIHALIDEKGKIYITNEIVEDAEAPINEGQK